MGRKKNTTLDIVAEIRERLPNYQANYVFWRFSRCCLPYEPKTGTFEELRENTPGFPADITERTAEQWELDDAVQGAIKLILERQNTKQLYQLHEQYFEMAQSDPQSLKALLELNKSLFKSEDNALMKLLQNVPDDLGGEDNG